MKPKFIEFTEKETNSRFLVNIDKIIFIAKNSLNTEVTIGIDGINNERLIKVLDVYENILLKISST